MSGFGHGSCMAGTWLGNASVPAQIECGTGEYVPPGEAAQFPLFWVDSDAAIVAAVRNITALRAGSGDVHGDGEQLHGEGVGKQSQPFFFPGFPPSVMLGASVSLAPLAAWRHGGSNSSGNSSSTDEGAMAVLTQDVVIAGAARA
jgi:hypothetical protein